MISDAPLWLTTALMLVIGVAAAWDVRTFTIPNAFPLIVLGMFVLAFPFLGFSFGALASHLGAGFVGFFVGYLLFVFGLMGGGDVKLFAALSLWLPIMRLFELVVAVTFAGGVLALVVIVAVWLKRLFTNTKGKDLPPLLKTRVPYGVAIFVGTLFMVLIGRI